LQTPPHSPGRIVAIHQPNFFPWLGYFDKIARADVFCLLDDVQFPKKGGTWMNRVQLAVQGRPAWATVPVDRSHSGVRSIRETRIEVGGAWQRRLMTTIRTNYARAAAFDECLPLIEHLIDQAGENLAEFNLRTIRALCEALGLDTSRLVCSSSLATTGRATDRLIEITRQCGGDVYMCGGGADGYQDETKFAAAGVDLKFQSFEHPTYPQAGGTAFVPGLSIIDALLCCGIAGTARLVKRD
jgi:hypothetical protein